MVAWTKVETVELMRSGHILNGLMVNNNNKSSDGLALGYES